MKYIKLYEAFDVEEFDEDNEDDKLMSDVFDILQECNDIGIEVSYFEPSDFQMNVVDSEVIAMRVTLYAGLVELMETDSIKKFRDIKPNIEHLISHMKSIGYNNFYYSDVETEFNITHTRKNIKGKINILPEDNDNISYIYLTFIRDGVYKGKIFA